MDAGKRERNRKCLFAAHSLTCFPGISDSLSRRSANDSTFLWTPEEKDNKNEKPVIRLRHSPLHGATGTLNMLPCAATLATSSTKVKVSNDMANFIFPFCFEFQISTEQTAVDNVVDTTDIRSWHVASFYVRLDPRTAHVPFAHLSMDGHPPNVPGTRLQGHLHSYPFTLNSKSVDFYFFGRFLSFISFSSVETVIQFIQSVEYFAGEVKDAV